MTESFIWSSKTSADVEIISVNGKEYLRWVAIPVYSSVCMLWCHALMYNIEQHWKNKSVLMFQPSCWSLTCLWRFNLWPFLWPSSSWVTSRNECPAPHCSSNLRTYIRLTSVILIHVWKTKQISTFFCCFQNVEQFLLTFTLWNIHWIWHCQLLWVF